MQTNSSIPDDILKIQKKLSTLQINSKQYKKYSKILAKHIKTHTMKKRVNSNIKTIEAIQKISKNSSKD